MKFGNALIDVYEMGSLLSITPRSNLLRMPSIQSSTPENGAAVAREDGRKRPDAVLCKLSLGIRLILHQRCLDGRYFAVEYEGHARGAGAGTIIRSLRKGMSWDDAIKNYVQY